MFSAIIAGITHVTLILGSNADILLTHKTLNTVTVSLAGLVEVSQRSVALVLGCSADVLHTQKVVGTVRIEVTGLAKLGQRSITSNLVDYRAVAGGVAVLVGLAVSVDFAGRTPSGLSRRSHSKASKHGRNNESSLHVGGLGEERKSLRPRSVDFAE